MIIAHYRRHWDSRPLTTRLSSKLAPDIMVGYPDRSRDSIIAKNRRLQVIVSFDPPAV